MLAAILLDKVLYFSIAVKVRQLKKIRIVINPCPFMNWENKKTDQLVTAILALKNSKEAKQFLRDLLTEDELMEFGNRWQAAQMLSQNISYTAIRGKTGLSPRTIARISRWLNKGKGGYRLIINRLHHRNFFPVGKGLR